MTGSFLELPARADKPRATGLTHVLDKGLTAPAVAGILAAVGHDVDVWKFGWGSAYVDRDLGTKLRLLREHDVVACIGGTLMEIAWYQGRVEAYLDWAGGHGIPAVEVSRGVVEMAIDDKRELIKLAAQSFTVFAETGLKDPRRMMSARRWREEITEDLEAGATWIVTEGRESGTVGVYDGTGSPRQDIVDAVVDAAGVQQVLFEAPRKDQQAWLVNRFGPEVNLANVAPDDVLPVTTLRLGLRADTVALSTTLRSVQGTTLRPASGTTLRSASAQ